MASAPAADDSKPTDRGPDGEKIVDMEYYDLLGVRGDASDADLKKAYRKLALKHHPDRNPGDEQAAEIFKTVGEAYNTLSDSNRRAYYNKHGKKQAGAPGEGGLEDATAMFSQMFGGERFFDWVGEIALAKEFTRAMDVTMTDEEKAELEKEAAASVGGRPPTSQPAQPANITAEAHVHDEPAVTGQAPAATSSYAAPPTADGQTPATPSPAAASTSTEAAKTESGATTPKTAASAKSNKLTAEQKKQLEALDEERAKEKEERVRMLSKKLVERLRPFVQATKPGEQGDSETVAFEKRMRLEADDLRLESFGVEMCKMIGSVYVTKATTFLRLHRKGPWSNVLGIPGWWSRVREKGTTIKEGWSFLTSTLDVQNAMEEAQKRQEKGELPEDEAKELDSDLMGKILLVSWRGTRFEVANVLRTVCDIVLSRHDPQTGEADRSVTDTVLINRAKGMLIIGAIMQAVVPDESDEERRELERLVAAAAAKSSSKKRKAKKEGSTTGHATPAEKAASPAPA